MRQANKSLLADLPVGVLICLILTPLAWALYLVSQIVVSGTISLVQVGMAGLCCLALFGLRGWGRWLCVIYDGLLVAALVYQVSQGNDSALLIAKSAAFALAAGALFWPSTIRIFRQAAPQTEAVARTQEQ